MKVQKLVTDTSYIDQPSGTYPKAYNILLNKAKGAITPEEGLKDILFLEGRDIVHLLPVDNDRLVIFSCDAFSEGSDTGTGSQISILDIGGTHTVLLKDDALAFDVFETYDSMFLRNFQRELFIVWTSLGSGTKILNLDDIPFELNEDLSLVDSSDADLMNMAPGFSSASLSMMEDQSPGGILETGVYYFTSVYEMSDGTTTSTGHMIGPVSITGSYVTDDPYNFVGSEPGVVSGNSIRLFVTNLDQRYKYVRIVAVKKVNGTVTASYVYKKRIDGTSFTFTYLGNEVHEDIDLEDITEEPVIYDGAKTLTYFGNRLYLGNVKGNLLKEYNYQKYANDIRIKWVTDEVEVDSVKGSYKDPYTILTKKGYFPDEVYAFYIRLLFANGSRSDGFHIPGPAAENVDPYIKGTNGGFSVTDKVSDIYEDSSVVNYRTPYEGEKVTYGKSHFLNDMEIGDDIRFFHTRETAVERNDGSNMGVWYNQDEFYSDDEDIWGELAGKQVRHHKFPAMDTFINADNPIISGSGTNELEVSSNGGIFLTVDKLSTREDEEKGQSSIIPLTLTNFFDPSVKNQEPIVTDDGDTTMYHSCTYHADADVGYYKKVKSIYSGLFFYNQASESKTVTINYDFSWVYTLVPDGYYNKDVMYRLTILHYYNQNDEYPYHPYADGSDIKNYVLDTFTDVESYADMIREISGSIDIDLVEGDSLSLVLDVTQPRDTGDSPISINSYFHKADITVVDSESSEASTGKARILGISADNITIPEEIAADVTGYEILYAKRDMSSMRVVGQSLLFGSALHPVDPYNVGSHAGNHITPIRVNENEKIGYAPYLRDDLIRFHAFDLMNAKPSVKPSFIKVGAILKTNLSDQKLITDKYYDPEEAEEDGRLDADTPVQAHYRADFVKARSKGSYDPVWELDRLRAVSSFKYIAADSITGYDSEVINNTFSEECALVKVAHPNPWITDNDQDKKVAYGWLPSNPDFYHNSESSNDPYMDSTYFLGSLYTHKYNLYSNLFDQSMVSTGKMFVTGGVAGTYETGNLFGGDTYFSLYGIRLTAAIYENAEKYLSINRYEALKTIYYFPCYSVNNINLRHAGEGFSESFYPQVGTSYGSYKEWLTAAADADGTNKFYYNEDYTSLNDLTAGYPYDQEEEFLSEFPYRVIRSKTYLPEDKEFSLRSFLTNDYIEMPKHRGTLQNLAVLGSTVLIHMRYSLFKTVSQETIATDSTEAALGTGDIFRLDPAEVITTKDGYGGTINMGACTVTPIGYVFIDSENGKVFLFDGKLQEISKVGNERWFNDNFKLALQEQLTSKGLVLDNPDNPVRYSGIGYSVVYDSKWNRIIVSKTDYTITDIDSHDLLATSSYATKLVFDDGRLKLLDIDGYHEINSPDGKSVFDGYLEDGTLERVVHTLSFSLDTNAWVCFHDYDPKLIVSTRNHMFSFDSKDIYLHNIEGTYAKYYGGTVHPSFVDAVYNMEPKITKQLQSLQWITEVYDGTTYLYNKTLSKILVFNNYQCSGYVEVIPRVNSRHNEGTWSFNDFKDIVVDRDLPAMVDGEPNEENLDVDMEWFNKKRISDKFIVVRYLYDNIDQNVLYLYELLASVLKSHR